ncbi:PEP-CTERM motif protein [Poriferisphaera corsica]|uniref:PEP-CTERM motif protein n=1 Tax=Poriferisphaera corsica TaxID=2528020 RepID=A0A517YYE7_9BACT|nr:PEP-CTERM sorting domain-containing protein [Poriferisphaera corsica]QDU35244.1 PEP-CTERM motif protein [Poriferisphaera corsica]
MRSTRLALAGLTAMTLASTSFAGMVYQDYEGTWDTDTDTVNFSYAITTSGSNQNIGAESTLEIVDGGYNSTKAAKIKIVASAADQAPDARYIVNKNATITAANPKVDANGYLGYYYKLDSQYADQAVKLALTIDDPGTADTAVKVDAIADGNWHMVQWSLDNNDDWDVFAYPGGLGNGQVDEAKISIDSLYIGGKEGANFEIFIDTITHAETGLTDVPEPASLALLGLGSLAFMRRRK